MTTLTHFYILLPRIIERMSIEDKINLGIAPYQKSGNTRLPKRVVAALDLERGKSELVFELNNEGKVEIRKNGEIGGTG